MLKLVGLVYEYIVVYLGEVDDFIVSSTDENRLLCYFYLIHLNFVFMTNRCYVFTHKNNNVCRFDT